MEEVLLLGLKALQCESPESVMAQIVGLMDDLFFQMKVLETAKHLGLEFKVATNADSLMELVATKPMRIFEPRT